MQLIVEAGGQVRCVYGEEIDLHALGDLSIDRGSHVEPTPDGKWTADLSPVKGPRLGPFRCRSEALAAEQNWLESNWLSPTPRFQGGEVLNLAEVAKHFRAAEREYHTAFQTYFDEEVQTLPGRRFWQLWAVFRAEAVHFRFQRNITNGIESAANELFRKALAGDFQLLCGRVTVASFTMAEAVQFAKSWRQLSRDLYEPLFDVVTGRGDDAYGDLLDALPLASRKVVMRALEHGYLNDRDLEEAVRSSCRVHPPMADLILHGENYVAASLFEAARQYFAIAPAY